MMITVDEFYKLNEIEIHNFLNEFNIYFNEESLDIEINRLYKKILVDPDNKIFKNFIIKKEIRRDFIGNFIRVDDQVIYSDSGSLKYLKLGKVLHITPKGFTIVPNNSPKSKINRPAEKVVKYIKE